jgi:hypothetical protein
LSLAVWVAVVQFLFATTWTIYVVYLPPLAAQAGIPRQWVPWILMADQLLFALMDVAAGYWLDRVRSSFVRIGPWILGVAAVSCAAFLALPFAGASPALFLAAIALWALTSSALRSPPWFLLSRHAATPRLPWLATLVLTGTALAGAMAPYLGFALRAVDPRVPFVASTVTLLAAVLLLTLAEKRAPGQPLESSNRPASRRTAPLFVGLLLLALGFQVHFALNSVPQYMRVALPGDLPYLMPVFWIGFNVLMLPAAALARRRDAADVMALAAALGALALVAVNYSPNLNLMIAAQFLAGGCWGAASVAAYSAAVALGGRFLGTLFAVLAFAVALRIGGVAAGIVRLPEVSALLPWIPQALWLLAGLVLLAARRG